MWASSTEQKEWFKSAKAILEKHNFSVIVQKQSIIMTNKNWGLPHVINSESEFIEYANRYGANIDIATIEKPRPAPRHEERQWRPKPPTGSTFRSERATSSPGDDREELQAIIKRLRAEGKTMIEQRNAWQQRASEAEARVQTLTATLSEIRSAGGTDRKFAELRRFLAREFHPDHSQFDGIEKLIRAEIFKAVWPKVEDIAKSKSN